MDKIALYRKYRPRNFEEVIGQEHIVSILKNAAKLGRISHAYLFSGPRGTGKTSVARILAREAGCSDIDLVEIDAASSRGIDEVRALREAVRLAPMQGEKKVYIIDEVHMLTKEAFNALLKTLEEPPRHTIFILATTEPEKVPETIISRCQHFPFKKIPEGLLSRAMEEFAQREGFAIDKETAFAIALLAEGSLRDALTILEKVLTYGDSNKDKSINIEEARKILAVPPKNLIEEMVLALIQGNPGAALEILEKARAQGEDLKIFFRLLLRSVRNYLVLALAPEMRERIAETAGKEEVDFFEKNKDLLESSKLSRILRILTHNYVSKEFFYLPETSLEIAIIDIIKNDDE